MRNGDVGTIYRTREPDSWLGLLVADLGVLALIGLAAWLATR